MICHGTGSLYTTFGQVLRFHYCRTHMLLEKLGVYPGQPPLLFALEKQEGLSQRDLAKKLNIKAATLTVMLNRMEKSMLVERRPDSNDQRVSRIYLTGKGRELMTKVVDALKVMENDCFSTFTEEEKVALNALLAKMRDNLISACGLDPNELS